MLQTIKMTLRLPGELHRELEKRAKATRKSLNAIVVDAIRRGLTQPPVEESEYERAIRALKESGLLTKPGLTWQNYPDSAEILSHQELQRKLAGLPSVSDLIIEEREPR